MRRLTLVLGPLVLSGALACSDEPPARSPDAAAADPRGRIGINPGTNLNDPFDDRRDGGAPDGR
jgi:hypothetical protein